MPRWQVQQDLPQWQDLLTWLGARRRPAAGKAVATNLVSIERSLAEFERPQIAPLASLASPAELELDASA
jgi:hypothetical protein